MPRRNSRSAWYTATILAATLSPAGAGAASITVWENTGYRGASTVLDGSIRALSALGWNDRISSLRVDSGQWEVCREVDFRGCRTLTADKMESLDSSWNDAISSLRPVSSAGTGSPDEQTAQRLYRAILGRDADGEGLRSAAALVARGQIAGLVRGLMQSNEYRSLRSQRSAGELLDQMYRGLLGRPADRAERQSYLSAIERGEDTQVIVNLLSSDEFLSGDVMSSTGTGTGSGSLGENEDISLAAEGAGLVVWGSNGRYESIYGMNVTLGRDHQARIELTGTTTQTLSGTWSREAQDLVRFRIPEVGDRRLNASATLQLDQEAIGRFQLIGGTPGAQSSAVMTFVADDYRPARDELLCHQEARARLEEERGATMAVLFLAPERSRLSSTRNELNGDALVLAERGHFAYNCQIDTRSGQVLEASIEKR